MLFAQSSTSIWCCVFRRQPACSLNLVLEIMKVSYIVIKLTDDDFDVNNNNTKSAIGTGKNLFEPCDTTLLKSKVLSQYMMAANSDRRIS